MMPVPMIHSLIHNPYRCLLCSRAKDTE